MIQFAPPMLTVIEQAEIVVVTAAVLLVVYVMYSLNLFKKE